MSAGVSAPRITRATFASSCGGVYSPSAGGEYAPSLLDRLPQGARMAPWSAASLLCFLGRMLLVLYCQPVTDATAPPSVCHHAHALSLHSPCELGRDSSATLP